MDRISKRPVSCFGLNRTVKSYTTTNCPSEVDRPQFMDDLRAGGWTNLGGEFGLPTRVGVPTDAGTGNSLCAFGGAHRAQLFRKPSLPSRACPMLVRGLLAGPRNRWFSRTPSLTRHDSLLCPWMKIALRTPLSVQSKPKAKTGCKAASRNTVMARRL